MKNFFLDPTTGVLSESRFWMFLAKFSMVIAFVYNVYKDTDTEWLWLVFGATFGVHEGFSRLLSYKYGSEKKEG